MTNLTQYLHFTEIMSKKASKLTAGGTVEDSINFVGHPVYVIFMTYTNFVGNIGITTTFGVSSGKIWDLN